MRENLAISNSPHDENRVVWSIRPLEKSESWLCNTAILSVEPAHLNSHYLLSRFGLDNPTQ
jgi:hypothetical protein